jgi:hypothetical protein
MYIGETFSFFALYLKGRGFIYKKDGCWGGGGGVFNDNVKKVGRGPKSFCHKLWFSRLSKLSLSGKPMFDRFVRFF